MLVPSLCLLRICRIECCTVCEFLFVSSQILVYDSVFGRFCMVVWIYFRHERKDCIMI